MSAEKQTSPALHRTRYGAAHPERVENALWERSMRENWSAYWLRQIQRVESSDSDFCQDFSHSSYRDATPGPFWSWERFGRTSTLLADGRVIHIAGEHEDAYDPDFCIYNDVVVEYPDGRVEFCLYPKEIFPPTDFHSATLVGDEIVLIGSLGYRDMRRVGETQVLKLDTRTLRIEPVETTGDAPGWISRHMAEKVGATTILVIGGMVQTQQQYEPNTGIFELDIATMNWQRRTHGDMALFPVSEAVYRQSKNPRYGKTNPERSDNPFWLEMARRQWPPSRARLHFGDFAPPKPELVLSDSGTGTADTAARTARIIADMERSKLARTIDDVVWTTVREDAVELTLPDGRKLLIGGNVADYRDEYADAWVYNDVVVTGPDGRIEILIYPNEVFPKLSALAGVTADDAVYIFGVFTRKLNPDGPRGPHVLRLDTTSYEITRLSVAAPAVRVNTHASLIFRDGNSVVFPIVRDHQRDPELCVAFDLGTHSWGKPYPKRMPQ